MKLDRTHSLAPLLALALLAAGPARAHEYWLEPAVWRAGAGETVSFGALAGVGFMGERKLYLPERVVRLTARAVEERAVERTAELLERSGMTSGSMRESREPA